MRGRLVIGVVVVTILLGLAGPAAAAKKADGKAPEAKLNAKLLEGLELRSLGPAVASGRIADIAVDPTDTSRYFVAVASGGVWRTVNSGTTWEPVMDDAGSYSFGCVTIDPSDPNIVWVGSGENNSQRSVSFGDGVYKSVDGGSTFTNVGLEESEHIGMIAVDPRNSDVVWVAAMGPLWRAGGDRGVYRTSDGGATWQRVLQVSDDTGFAEVRLDLDDPDTVWATAYQRRRRQWTLINGGPESALYRSSDGGASWAKVEQGLPKKVDLGRIGLCQSPVDHDVLYAIVDAAQDEAGVFRSTDRGRSWTKRSDHHTGGDYYNEVICDPADVDRLYSVDMYLHVSDDGGASFTAYDEEFKHVDNHALWVDPADPRHLRDGCDGGVYESFDRGATWQFLANLPVTQFYRVAVDTSEPFYFVYGGTQDNASWGGPSRTTRAGGIANEDWFVTTFGDGFQSRVDPEDPATVYSESQYGGLVRFDRTTGEAVDIQPQEAPGEAPHRWNWDAPLIISPHAHTRLYFAAQRLYRSDDRGDSWQAISGDLSRGIDRNQLEVMGRVWEPDALYKNGSTSFYGNAVSLDESPLVEGLLYVGTDDGLVWISPDGGASWRSVASFPGIPAHTYVSDLRASRHDPDTVYAAFSNLKSGDFTPYLLKSTDRGASWSSVRGDLPDRQIVWSVVEDDADPGLLFAGTELGLFVTFDGGAHWLPLAGGLPTVAVKDIEIQRREHDLVLATFGRGFYVLDDYTPLRQLSEETLAEPALLLPVKDAWRYIETSRFGLPVRAKGMQGDSYYVAPNPPFGAVFTYYLRDGLKTREERRHEAEAKAREAGTTLPYPGLEALRAEDEEREPRVLLVVRDAAGDVVRRVTGAREAGLHRMAWDLRLPSAAPTTLEHPEPAPWDRPDVGPLALPGRYAVTLEQEVDGVVSTLAGPVEFAVADLPEGTLTGDDPAATLAFRQRVADLQRAVDGAAAVAADAADRIDLLRVTILDTPDADPAWLAELAAIDGELHRLTTELVGDATRAKRQEPAPPSISARVGRIVGNQWFTTAPPTATERAAYDWAATAFETNLAGLRSLMDERLMGLERQLEAAGAPWTPGRLPDWHRK